MKPQDKGRVRENRPTRHDFVIELRDLIVIPNIADRLRAPGKTDKVLGPHKDTWCEFHQTFGHTISNCLTLAHQLDELVKSGFLKHYLAGPPGAEALAAVVEEQAHEMPIHGEIHTTSSGFSGGGCTALQRKRYARSVMFVVGQVAANDLMDVDLTFTRADLHNVVPHDNDPVVISVVTAGRKVHRVLMDQGSSANVMFLSMFNKLQLSPDFLRPYTGCLYGFVGDQVEVRGYLELRTTFTDGTASRTESIRYLVVNANSAYNILLGRPALNRLRAVASKRHMKLKLPDLSGRVIVIKSDQEEARKCYENSLKTNRGMFVVTKRPGHGETLMEVDPAEAPLKGYVHMGRTPVEVEPMEGTPAGAEPRKEASVGGVAREDGGRGVARPEDARERRPEPIENVVKRQIGGRTFRLGRRLSQEEQDQVATVISRHLDAFAWSASDMPGIDPDFICHHLTMDPKVRPVRQKRIKFNEERRIVVQEETKKLLSVGHIREIQYLEWLANVVLVKKANGK